MGSGKYQVEVDDHEISIGAIIGSGSFAEVRKAWLKRTHPESDGSAIDTITATTIMRRARGTSSVVPSIAVKVLKDVKRKTLRRFWDEVLIMKVMYYDARLTFFLTHWLLILLVYSFSLQLYYNALECE